MFKTNVVILDKTIACIKSTSCCKNSILPYNLFREFPL